MRLSQNLNSHTKRLGISPRRFAFVIAFCGVIGTFTSVYANNTCVNLHGNYINYKIVVDSIFTDFSSPFNDTTQAEIDSLDLELDALAAELDTTESDTADTKWSFVANTKYRSQDQRNGVDISNGLPTFFNSVKLSHAIGLELSASTSHRIKTKKLDYQDFSLALSYEYQAADWVDLSAGLTRTKYQTDTTNALAGSSFIISLMADFYIKRFIIDLSLDRYTGDDASTSLSLTTLYPFKYKDLSIITMLGASLLSYEITTNRLKSTTKTTKAKTKKALSLSSVVASLPISYPIYRGISMNFTPTFSYSPIETVSSNRTQLVVSLGLKYSLDF
ncbi:MAG: hypothetical protein IPM69_08750 [Ignavibacteria bacterium]|nr:hypothetical protein [Ignavibacteria bacterium]